MPPPDVRVEELTLRFEVDVAAKDRYVSFQLRLREEVEKILLQEGLQVRGWSSVIYARGMTIGDVEALRRKDR